MLVLYEIQLERHIASNSDRDKKIVCINIVTELWIISIDGNNEYPLFWIYIASERVCLHHHWILLFAKCTTEHDIKNSIHWLFIIIEMDSLTFYVIILQMNKKMRSRHVVNYFFSARIMFGSKTVHDNLKINLLTSWFFPWVNLKQNFFFLLTPTVRWSSTYCSCLRIVQKFSKWCSWWWSNMLMWIKMLERIDCFVA